MAPTDDGAGPMIALAAALVPALPLLFWVVRGDPGWIPAMLYGPYVAACAWYAHRHVGPRTTSAMLVAGALLLAFLLPIAWVPIDPSEA